MMRTGLDAAAEHAFMLYGAPTFSLASCLVDPVLVGLLAAAATTVIAPPLRWFVPAATADAIRSIAPVLGAAFPRAHDDRNELPDAVEHDVHRRPDMTHRFIPVLIALMVSLSVVTNAAARPGGGETYSSDRGSDRGSEDRSSRDYDSDD